MKKKVLLISPYFPYPPYDGGKVRIYNLIKTLSKENDVTLLSYIETREAQEHFVPFIEKYCKAVYTVIREENNRLIRADIPRSPTFYYTQQMIEKLEAVINEVRPDIVQIEFLVMTQYINHIKDIPAVYTEHDMSSVDFDKSFHDRDMQEKLRFAEWVKLVEYSKRILKKFEGIIVLTERDRHILDKFAPGLNIAIAPTGVDINYYTPDVKKSNAEKHIVFIGHYKHYPNADAVKYFIERIWPMIQAEEPDAKFYIVGSSPGLDIKKYSSNKVVVTGEVKDVREYLHNASVFVAPVRLGGGIKGKVLEAMACGVPVVATAEVCAGFMNNPGRDILKATNEGDFAKMTVNLLRDPVKSGKIAENARNLVEEYYNWDKIGAGINLFYDNILSGKTLKT